MNIPLNAPLNAPLNNPSNNPFRFSNNRPLIAVLALLAVGLPGSHASAASRASSDDHRSMVVRYNDLDIHSAKGVETLRKRIDRAVESVCGEDDVSELRPLHQSNEECKRESRRNAMMQLDHIIAD